MYAINAVIIRGELSSHVPTFYLDENVQGIVDEIHAIKIAREIVDPFKEYVINHNAESLADTKILGTGKAFIFALKIK